MRVLIHEWTGIIVRNDAARKSLRKEMGDIGQILCVALLCPSLGL